MNQWLPETNCANYVIVHMPRKISTKNKYNLGKKIMQKLKHFG